MVAEFYKDWISLGFISYELCSYVRYTFNLIIPVCNFVSNVQTHNIHYNISMNVHYHYYKGINSVNINYLFHAEHFVIFFCFSGTNCILIRK